MVEGEARILSSSALTCAFSHLYLRDASFDFTALLEPVHPESCATAGEAVKGPVEALLKNFLTVGPAAAADGKDNGDIIDDETPQVGDGGVQG